MSLDRVRLCYPEQGDELWVGGKMVRKREVLRLLLQLVKHLTGHQEKDRPWLVRTNIVVNIVELSV